MNSEFLDHLCITAQRFEELKDIVAMALVESDTISGAALSIDARVPNPLEKIVCGMSLSMCVTAMSRSGLIVSVAPAPVSLVSVMEKLFGLDKQDPDKSDMQVDENGNIS